MEFQICSTKFRCGYLCGKGKIANTDCVLITAIRYPIVCVLCSYLCRNDKIANSDVCSHNRNKASDCLCAMWILVQKWQNCKLRLWSCNRNGHPIAYVEIGALSCWTRPNPLRRTRTGITCLKGCLHTFSRSQKLVSIPGVLLISSWVNPISLSSHPQLHVYIVVDRQYPWLHGGLWYTRIFLFD